MKIGPLEDLKKDGIIQPYDLEDAFFSFYKVQNYTSLKNISCFDNRLGIISTLVKNDPGQVTDSLSKSLSSQVKKYCHADGENLSERNYEPLCDYYSKIQSTIYEALSNPKKEENNKD